MRILVHVQFLALMLPTVLLLVLAAVSLADLDAHGAAHHPAIFLQAAPGAVDAAPPEPAY